MSYAPARVRSRAPWIAFLLVPLLALAALLVPATAATAAAGDIAGATLSWGFKQSFRSYLTGPIAHGHVTGTGVDTATPYGWSGGTGTSASNAVAYPGTLQFQGHQGMVAGDPTAYALDVTITDVRVKITSATAGELQADVVSRDMNTGALVSYPDTVIASLDLAGGTNASTATTVAYTGVPAALTAAGVPAFAGFYAAGSALDPVSFTWPIEQAPARTATATVTSVSQATGATVQVAGTNFAGITAAYASIIEKGSEYTYIGAAAQMAITGGAFAQTLVAPTASLDPAKQYEVLIWQTRSNPSAATIYARADIAIAADQWKVLFPPVPAITTSVTGATAADGLTLTVAGTGYDGNTAAYVSIIEKGSEYTYIGAAKQVTIVEGAFSQVLTAPAASLDKTKQYEVITWKTRTNPGAATIFARTDITVTDGQWNAIFPPPVPTLAASVTGASASDGLTVSVDGTVFDGITAAYLSIIEKGSEYTYIGAAKQLTITGGGFTQSLTAPAASLDRTKQYEIIAWKTRSNPSAETIYARADLTVAPEQWNAVFPPAVPTVVPTVTSASAASGLAIDLDGTGFDDITAAYAAIIEKGTEAGVGQSGGFIGNPIEITAIADGAFDETLTAPTAQLDKTKQYEVIVWKTRSNPNATTIYARADITVTPQQWNTIFPPAVPTVGVSVTGVSKADGVALRVTGSGFDGVTAAYAAVIEKGTEAGVGQNSGTIGNAAVVNSITGGAFTLTLGAPTAQLDKAKQYEVIVWKTATAPNASTIYDRADITISAAQWNTLFPPVVVPPTPTPGAGSLTWGVKASFRSYVTGPIAHGSITTSGVASNGSGYVFPQSGAATMSNGIGSVTYSGSVRFTGHGGLLDLRLSDPQIRVDSATSGTLFLRVNGGTRVAFASLALASGSKTTAADGSVTYSGVPATITAAGSSAFSLEGSSFYPAGTALDPATFTVGSAGVSLGGTVTTVSERAATATANTPDPAPPATEGVTVDGSPVEGGTITAEADGFQPNEAGILVVIYSTPTILAENLTADANGRVTWTGTLPRGLSGEHTLTFQGSVDRGVVLDIAAAAELQCTVSDASLVWGFKETFRAYIDGSIANGEWTTDGDVSYETPVFTWAAGTGGADLEEGALDVQYSGSVRFTGHGGALDTTVANPRVVVDGDSAVLLLDVTGTTQAGDVVEATAVEFAELDLSGVDAARDGDTVTWADVPATLTAAGAEAFGTYPEGEALDPVTIVATVDSECATAAEPTTEPTTDEIEPETVADSGWPLWATILIVVVVLLAIAGLVIALVRRSRKAA